MIFHDFNSFAINEDFIITDSVAPLVLHRGAAEFGCKNMMSPVNIPWVGPTISPCDSPLSDYIEHPTGAIEYYNDRGVVDLVCELKMMGSRAFIVFDNETNCLFAYSRGLRNIKLTDDEFSRLKLDARHFCLSNNINGFIADSEMLPWNKLSNNLINRDFIIPALAYGCSVGKNIYYNKYVKVLNKYITDDKLKFYIFDILAIKNDNWEICDNRRKLYTFDNDLNLLYDIPYRKFFNLNNKIEVDTIINDWLFYTESELFEGFVFKPVYRQFNSTDFINLPYMKCRGKEYLRIVYGIEYEDYIEELKLRRTKWKRMQSIGEYILAKNIIKNWIKAINDDNNHVNLNYLFAYIGLSKSNRAMKIDATL
jgi:protein phosphatase